MTDRNSIARSEVDTVRMAISELTYRDRLMERLWVEARTEHSQETGSWSKPDSQPPWTEPFASTVTTIEAGAVALMDTLHDAMGFPRRRYSPQRALRHIPDALTIIADRGMDDELTDVWFAWCKEVRGWARIGRRDLDEARPDEVPYWTKAPVTHTGQPLVCHLCEGNLWLKTAEIRGQDAPPLYCRSCVDIAYPASSWTAALQPEQHEVA